MKKRLILVAALCGLVLPVGAADLKESKFTQVVNDVQIISTADNSKRAAAIDGIFKIPDVLRTGPASRAELVADDRTITRVGANTIFSFDRANRSIRLEQGSLLFNSPKGKGGGNIHTAAATAAVIGTTLIVTTTPNGGFKVLTLEGRANVMYQNGGRQRLDAGQMTFVLPGGVAGPVVMFRLDQQVANSALVKGFQKTLPSQPRIDSAISKQEGEIQAGRAEDTGLLVGEEASPNGVQVIQLFDQLSASTNAIPGVVPSKLPRGFSVPPRLVFKEEEGGFTAADGSRDLLFVSSPERGTNPAVAIEYSAGPADAALDPQTINAPLTSTDTRVFRQSVDIFATDPDTGLPTTVAYPSFMGFIGQSISINTPTLDLNQFAPMDHFDFLSLGDLNIAANLDISAAQIPEVTLMAGEGNRVLIAPGTTVNIDSPAAFIESPAGLTLDSVTITKQGNAGVLGLFASSADFATSSSISMNNSFVSAEDLQIATDGAFSATGTSATSGGLTGTSRVSVNSASGATIGVDVTSDANTGTINIVNNSGQTIVNNGAGLRGSTINVISPGGLVLNNATISGNQATLTGGSSFGAAGGTVNVQNSTLTGTNSLAIRSNGGDPLTIDSSQISGGGISVNSRDDLSLNDTAISANTVNLNADGTLTLARSVATAGNIHGDSSVHFEAEGGTTVGVNVTAGTTPTSGSISMDNNSGLLSITPGVTLTANFIGASSRDGVLVDGATLSGNQGSLTAASSDGSGVVRVQNSTLNLASALDVRGRGGVQLDGATMTGGQLNLSAGDASEDPEPGAGSVSVASSTFDLTGGASIQNDTGTLTIDNNSRITAAGSVEVDSLNGLSFNNANISGNQVSLNTGGRDSEDEVIPGPVLVQSSTLAAPSGNLSVTASGSSAAFNNATLTAGNNLTVDAGSVNLNNTVLDAGTVTVDSDTFITAPNVPAGVGRITGVAGVNLMANSGTTIGVNVSATGPNGAINIENRGGTLNAGGNATFQAAFITVSSPRGLLFDRTTVNASTRVNLNGGRQAGTPTLVQNTSFTGLGEVNIAGHTVVLSDVNFANGSVVNLSSLLGQLAADPNTGKQVQNGFVNYILNVNYGGAPAQGFTGLAGEGKQITIRPLP